MTRPAYVYNGFGDVIQESSPNTGTTVYYYDGAGNRTKRVAPTSAVTNYAYDTLDRVVTMSFPSDSAENVSYAYDQSGHGYGIGRLTSVSDAGGTLSRTYDQFGNLLTDVRSLPKSKGKSTILATSYAYDNANRIASITYPSGALVNYARDIMGRITAVTAQPKGGTSAPVVSSVTYEPFGPSSTLTYGNGVAEARAFDEDYRLTALTDAGTSTLQKLTYAYYPTNNVQTIADSVNSGNSQSFNYDNLQRLNQAQGGYGAFAFTYDKDGNRVNQTLGSVTTSYSYGTATDLLNTISVGGTLAQTIGYTADGRIASLSPGVSTPGGQLITSLSYNQDGRLAAINPGKKTVLASYTYDGFGQRFVKTISSTYGRIYQYGQDGMLLEETDASGVAQADYIYLDGRPISTLNPATGLLYFLHDDMLGTPQLATDSSQNIAWQASYQPFGTASVSGTITQNLRLPGQYFDLESGWNHNGFRDYLPDLGRYAEPDPLALQGTAGYYDLSDGRLTSDNQGRSGSPFYPYAHNNPINRADPFGLWDTYTHHALIWNALRACGVSNDDIWQIQEESDFIDLVDQLPDDAYKHAMKAPWQSPQSAIHDTNEWIQDNLNSASQMYQQFGDTIGMGNPTDTWTTPFGDAVHAMTDATSPMHRQNGMPQSWPWYPNAFHHGGPGNPFGSGESWADMTPDLMQQNLAAIQRAYEQVTGKKCGCQQ